MSFDSFVSPVLRAASLCLVGMLCSVPAWAQDATDAAPTLEVSGETRARYESLDGQFRAGRSGSDQILALRTLLRADLKARGLTWTLELQDSRTYLDDAGTPNSASITNPLDVLQLAVTVPAPGILGTTSTGQVTLGRQTVSIGSKRQIERVDFANVIKSYTGAHYVAKRPGGDQLHLLAVVPTARFPSDRPSIDDNRLSGDEEQWGRRILGAHYIRPNALGDVTGEVFVYGLTEEDTDAVPTPNRQYIAPGLRLSRPRSAGYFDLDLEIAGRFGSRRATSADSDTADLDVSAAMAFAALGYTWDAPWRPRLAAEFYYASGDDDPNDDRFDQHERLFGSRRTDLNNTSIHGPLTPANLVAPGARLEVTPSPKTDARLAYSAGYLASDTDSFVIARLRDPSGASGDFVGHTLDGRARYHLTDDVTFELGASAFFWGDFTKTTRAAEGLPPQDRTLFGYAQVTVTF